MNYFQNLTCALSQLANALAGGNHNELLSARAYRTKNIALVWIINKAFRDPNHCKDAFEFEQDCPQLPFPEYMKERSLMDLAKDEIVNNLIDRFLE